MLSVITEDHKVQWKPLHRNCTFPGVEKARNEGRLQGASKTLTTLSYFIFFVEFIEAKIILFHLLSIDLFIYMFIFFLPYSISLLQIAYLTVLIIKSRKWFNPLKSRYWKNCVPFGGL